MSFISIEFILFLTVVTVMHFALPHRWRWLLLMLASFYFYAYWRLDVFFLFLAVIMLNYGAARYIDAQPKEAVGRRRLGLAVALAGSLGSLAFFKYTNFLIETLNTFLTQLGTTGRVDVLNIILPLGISFYTFQALAYTIDVYRGDIAAEKHAGIFATFIAFFPQLVAGPIERAAALLPQFRVEHHFDVDRAVSGLRLILWGAFKKVVVADRLVIYTSQVSTHPSDFSGPHILMIYIFYPVLLYSDFSAYSDIARGAARLLGFELMVNFRQPLLAPSYREFWRRWHISLSSWFRDYVYFPLGGSRVSPPRQLFNGLIVFTLVGLWHGANWTFVIWGFLQGVLLAVETMLDRAGLLRWQERMPAVGAIVTFALFTLSGTFFVSPTLDIAFYLFQHVGDLGTGWDQVASPYGAVALFGQPWLEFGLAWLAMASLMIVDGIQLAGGRFFGRPVSLDALLPPVRWGLYYLTALAVIISFSVAQADFVYFQF